MLSIYEHNIRDCLHLLNMLICDIPFLKTFGDNCLLERLLSLISIITSAFDGDHRNQWSIPTTLDTDEEREPAIREWLLRHYNAKCLIDDLNFADTDDRTRVAILIINILFKLRHSLKDIEQYLQDCESFVQFDQQLNEYTRFDKLLEMVSNDCNRWRSEARECKVKLEETKKLMDKYQQNEIFNYNCNPRNQNLYKSRIDLNKPSDEWLQRRRRALEETRKRRTLQTSSTAAIDADEMLDLPDDASGKDLPTNGYNSDDTDGSFNRRVNNEVISFVCVDCDQNYSTNFEFNLHLLKDHKNVDISEIIRNAKRNADYDVDYASSIDMSVTTGTAADGDPNVPKKCRTQQKKRYYRCVYYKCGKAFFKLQELKRHFIKHQPKVQRTVRVFTAQTNAQLNHIRHPKPSKLSPVCHQSSHNSVDIKTKLEISFTNDTNNYNNHNSNHNIRANYHNNVNHCYDSHMNYANSNGWPPSNRTDSPTDIAYSDMNGVCAVNPYQMLTVGETVSADEAIRLNGHLNECQSQEDYCFGLQLRNAKTYSKANGINGDTDSNDS